MIKTAIKLLIALAILNAAARGAMAAWQHYQLEDEARQLITFGAAASTQALQNAILAKAAELEVPLEPQNVTVRRDGPRTFADAAYTQPVEFFPGFTYPVSFDFSVDALNMRATTPEDVVSP